MRDPQPQHGAASRNNEWGQPIGASLASFRAPPVPEAREHAGVWCRLRPLELGHFDGLWQAFRSAPENAWTYLPYGPFTMEPEFRGWLSTQVGSLDPLFFTAFDLASGRPLGLVSLLRIVPEMASIEVGHIHFSPAMQRTPAATEAVALLARYVFEELGYRRFEWKCDALNAPSRSAAGRLGFRFEGVFRQHLIYKQRSRDTAWYSLLDSEWPARGRAFDRWLAPGNFTADGTQTTRLGRVEECG